MRYAKSSRYAALAGKQLCMGFLSGNTTPFCGQVTKESTWQHPLLPYYKGAAFMAMGGNAAMVKAEATKPCTATEV